MSIINNTLLLGSGDEGYNLTRSLRFRKSASTYLNRTMTTATDAKKWTWSGWVKRGSFDQSGLIATGNSTTDGSGITFVYGTGATLCFYDYISSTFTTNLVTTQVFRDPSAWYHIIVAVDTTQATSSNRVKMYVNGTQITSFSAATYPALNSTGYMNSGTYATTIGREGGFGNYFDGYLAEMNFIDGQALTPSSFCETDITTGVWKPKRYAGTYGTNGFYLPFTDNSALTTSSNVGLGKDFSGNGNYWTTNNISITAGVTYDSMTDVPTLTSATAANFAVLNPLNAAATLNDGNMNARVTGTGGNYSVSSTIALSSGLIYFETTPYVFSLVNGQIGEFGICYATANLQSVGTRITNSGVGVGFGFGQGSSTWFSRNFGTLTNLTGLSNFTTTTIAMVAINLTTGNMWVGKDGTWYNSGNPATGANPTITGIPSAQYAIGITAYQDAGLAVFQAVNFGQRPFAYTPPTGFVALNTYNLPTSTIVKGNTVMDATLWTGDGSSPRSITNSAGFKPDLVWAKNRSTSGYWNVLFDSVRGAGNQLSSNQTDAELASASNVAGKVSAFNSNGFSLEVGNTSIRSVNGNTETYVGWQWQAGQGSSSSNTSGTITSTVSVNASAGFSICTLTTPASGICTFGHGLGVAPSLVLTKYRSSTSDWLSYHSSVGNTAYLLLNGTNAATTNANTWNNTSPTSSVVTLGSDFSGTRSIVAYCWTPIAGYSAFGSYTANGVADGPFIYTGFRPKFIMVKNYEAANTNWTIIDTSRDTYNGMQNVLLAESSAAETTGSTPPYCDAVANGFKLRSGNAYMNYSTSKYIYMAFAENPFKNSLAR